MKHISKFTFSITLVLLSFLSNAQEKTSKENINIEKGIAKDSIPPKTERYGLRVGVDFYKLSRSFFEKEYKSI